MKDGIADKKYCDGRHTQFTITSHVRIHVIVMRIWTTHGSYIGN